MMALLLVVFVPPLTMDAIAGRRERGRLEHMLVGVRPSALLCGAFLACAGLVGLLLIPLVLFHLVLGPYDPDPGHTIGGALPLCSKAWQWLHLVS